MTKESAVIAKDGELGVDRRLDTLVGSMEKDVEKGGDNERLLGSRGNDSRVKFQFCR